MEFLYFCSGSCFSHTEDTKVENLKLLCTSKGEGGYFQPFINICLEGEGKRHHVPPDKCVQFVHGILVAVKEFQLKAKF